MGSDPITKRFRCTGRRMLGKVGLPENGEKGTAEILLKITDNYSVLIWTLECYI